MINYNEMRAIVAKGLREYVGCPIVRSNQNEPYPEYPFISYTVTTLLSENKGTYGQYEDGTERKPYTQTWSVSALSKDNAESVALACKAREWLDRVGTTYLSDNGVIVQSVGSVTNRDNFLTVEYEYKNGFDVVFALFDEISSTAETDGVIQTTNVNIANVGDIDIDEPPPSVEELNALLEKRLDGEVS